MFSFGKANLGVGKNIYMNMLIDTSEKLSTMADLKPIFGNTLHYYLEYICEEFMNK
jgi:hypothetical protein